MTQEAPNVDRDELSHFEALAERWWDETGPLKTLHQINPLRVDYIDQRADLAGTRVLDVGCGGGILSEALAQLGAQVTGIDMAEPSLGVAAAHAKESGLSIDYRNISAEAEASQSPSGYDLVTCLELLEHVPQPDRIVDACASAVRPGGHVFFSTINRNLKSFLMAIVGAEHVLRMVPRGTHEYDKLVRPSELARWCRAAGLELLDVTGLHFNPLTQSYSVGGNVDVNYFAHARRPETE